MGPQILLDKCTLQSLSQSETDFLQKHYWVVYSPILFIEILGDYKKFTNDIEKSKKEVAKIAWKINGYNSTFTANYRLLLHDDLIGLNVPMDHRPLLLGGKEVIVGNGERGVFCDEEPEHKALRRWGEGKFSEAEEVLSDNWRKSTKAINLDGWRKIFRDSPNVYSFNDLKSYASTLMNNPNTQYDNLQWLLDEVSFDDSYKTPIFNRWINKGMPPLKLFSPYAYYCLHVLITFYLGIANGLIGTKPTNRIDLEYVFYFPFCKVFASTDKVLKQFSPLFLENNQDFVWGDDLKKDLREISQYWEHLNDDEKRNYRKKYGDYPPDNPNSITNQLWIKHMRPRDEYGEDEESTPEQVQKILKKFRPILDQIKKQDENV